MNLEDFLARLEKVRRSSPNNWLARCPAHDDRSPSLSVGRGDNGGVIIRCFAECSVESIVGALGLSLSDLMPERLPQGREYVPAMPRPIPAADVLEALSFECEVICLLAGDLEEGRALSAADIERLRLARERIQEGRRLAAGRWLAVKGKRRYPTERASG